MLRMQGSSREIALTMVRRDGSRLPVLVNSVLERDVHGEPRVVRHAVFDATERRRYERELMAAKERAERSEAKVAALARTLQNSLIPPTPPQIPGLDVAARYRPAGDGTEVGGDFYDVFQIGAGDWAVVIGDVCGKGVDAAVVTALVRHTLRAASVAHPQPVQALRFLNEVLQRHETERFCTVAYVRLRQSDDGWSATICVGGHPLPLLRSADGAVRAVGSPGSLIGVVDDPALDDVTLVLQPGDLVLLCTDGVSEGRRGREFYGEQRIADVVAAAPGCADELATALLDDVLAFQGDRARDDIAVMAIGVPREAPRG
jgi:sigma-B regulation protein RsbU (phosphoserine phosphatase)